MPFWWRRRRRPWFGRYRRNKRRYPYKRRRRTFTRRRGRTTFKRRRRRRRRRYKVKKKKPTLIVRQWQPDSIVLCKIKGYQPLVMGAEGVQYLCYTTEMFETVKPKYPAGGVFAVQLFSLKYLYDQWLLRNNIWTKTNEYKDLCRYLKVIIYVYRHPKVDFILTYNRQPPFNIDQISYQNFHPFQMLLQKHKRIVPSLKTNPRGRSKIKIVIKPPKQMLNKWFFQQQFADYDLLQLAASAMSLQYPRLGCCNENRIITIYYINPTFYKDSNWAFTPTEDKYYEPYTNFPDYTFVSGKASNPINYKPVDTIKKHTQPGIHAKYYASVSYEEGFFSTRILQAWDIKNGTQSWRPLPIAIARYNPELDDGKGNKIWLASITGGHFDIPTKTPDLVMEGIPLWLAFWGYWSYIKSKYTNSYLGLHMFVVQSPYIYPGQTEQTKNFFPFIDWDIIQGKDQYDSFLTKTEKSLWFPTCHWQIKTLNAFCESGPYVPKLSNDRDSTWELPIKYNFQFKWGGPQIENQTVENPKSKNKYPVPDTIQERLQVVDPTKNIAATMFHQWDYRRGCLTSTAIKRMQENLPTDESLSSDSDTETPQKKRRVQPTLHDPEKKTKKIQNCLLSLCEENTCQDPEETSDILQLIHNQQQQQQQLKHNLLTLIKDLKCKQRLLQLQTGVLE
nr:MAG: ORF1 [Torque teno midi virus]